MPSPPEQQAAGAERGGLQEAEQVQGGDVSPAAAVDGDGVSLGLGSEPEAIQTDTHTQPHTDTPTGTAL